MRVHGLNIALISMHSPRGSEAPGNDESAGCVLQLARALARDGHRVDVFNRREDSLEAAISSPHPGVRVLMVDAGPVAPLSEEALLRHVPAFANAVGQVMQRGAGYDVVHANRLLAGLVAQRLKESLGIPFAVSFHSLEISRREHQPESDPFRHLRVDIERRVVRQADRVIAECPRQRDLLERCYGARMEQVVLAPCGVDTELFAPVDRESARGQSGIHADEFAMLHVGRLEARKGIDNVIRALGRLSPDVNARLILVGEDARSDAGEARESDRLRDLAHECGVQDRVSFMGRRAPRELPAIYSSADVLVATPWFEPFGSAPLQAMACGIPVIASDIGAQSFTIADGVTGFLVRPRDPVGLALRLAQLHANPALGRTLGLAGQRRVQALFGWSRIAQELGLHYRRMGEEALSLPPSRIVASTSHAGIFAHRGTAAVDERFMADESMHDMPLHARGHERAARQYVAAG